MPAFFIATITMKDQALFQEYSAKARDSMQPFGGAIVKRGFTGQALLGSADHHAVGIAEFPDMDALKSWFESPGYQALADLRDRAADTTLVSYDVPD